MEPEQLDEMIAASGQELRERLGELHPHILEAAHAVLEEFQDNHGKGAASITIAVSIKIDMAKKPPAWMMEASVGLKHKSKGVSHEAGDTTPDLPGLDDDAEAGMPATSEPPAKPKRGRKAK